MQTQPFAQSGPADTLGALCEQALSCFDSCFPHIRTLRMAAVGSGGSGDEEADPRVRELLAADLKSLGDHEASAALTEAVTRLIEAADAAGKPDNDSIGAAGMAVVSAHRAMIDQALAIDRSMSGAQGGESEPAAPPSALAKMKMRKATDLPISRMMSTLQFRDSLSQRLDHMDQAFEIARPTPSAAQFWARLQSAHIGSWAETLRDAAQTAASESSSLLEAIASGQLGEGGTLVTTVLDIVRLRDEFGEAVQLLREAAVAVSQSHTELQPMIGQFADAVHAYMSGPATDLIDRCWMPEAAPTAPTRMLLQIAADSIAIRDALNDLLPVAAQLESLGSDIALPMDGFEMNADAEAVRDSFAALYTVDVEHAVHRTIQQQL